MALYSGNPVPGARRDLKTRDITLGRRLLSLRQSATKRVVQRNLRRRPDPVARVLLAIGAIGAATLSLMFGIFAIDDQRGGLWPFLLFSGAIVAAIVTLLVVANVRPLTERGREARDHLEGLRLYIRLAEADRLRVLQSPSGAMRVDRPAAASVAAAAPRRRVRRSRPRRSTRPWCSSSTSASCRTPCSSGSSASGSASWPRCTRRRARPRAGTPGATASTPASFSVAVSSFSSASSTSWSGSSSSSSSSGSGGGGSSGGGGGGGGGGGV